jgi:tetratricopeptide (TPR) repeat protein
MRRAAIRTFPVHFPVYLTLLALILGGRSSRAEDAPNPAFSQGNALYGGGDYFRAATAYEIMVHSGIYSGNLFDNLGNTYARLGQPGRAVLNYRRALALDPADAEARANLASLPGHPAAPDGSWLNRQTHLPDIDLWPIAGAGAGLLGLASMCLGRRTPWRRLVAALGLGVCLWCAGAAWWLDGGSKNAAAAIVVNEQSRVLDTPAVNSKPITNLPAGSEVRVLSTQGAWVYVLLADGARGWLAASAVERIIPPGYGSTK